MNIFKESSGFTLLEIMLATIFLATALIPILNLFSTGLFGSQESEDMTIALNLARAGMEQVKAEMEKAKKEESSLPLGKKISPQGRFILEREVYYEITPNLKRVLITTFKEENDGSRNKLVELATLLTE